MGGGTNKKEGQVTIRNVKVGGGGVRWVVVGGAVLISLGDAHKRC